MLNSASSVRSSAAISALHSDVSAALPRSPSSHSHRSTRFSHVAAPQSVPTTGPRRWCTATSLCATPSCWCSKRKTPSPAERETRSWGFSLPSSSSTRETLGFWIDGRKDEALHASAMWAERSPKRRRVGFRLGETSIQTHLSVLTPRRCSSASSKGCVSKPTECPPLGPSITEALLLLDIVELVCGLVLDCLVSSGPCGGVAWRFSGPVGKGAWALHLFCSQ
mmetsp:Transcript_18967/g.46594  ORF Transcript_18967/g.46594 Transcript_18967/m.46594 type:complete len:223 (+) Transcript_18967:873-1541(+)